MKATLLTLTAALVAALVTLGSGTAEAAFPGVNGRIVFTEWISGNSEIYSINPDGSGRQRLTNHLADDSDPAVSPDRTRIAFASDRSGSWDIYVMNANGSNPTRLTFANTWEANPAWSPDGNKIAFVRAGEDWDYDVLVMDVDGSNQALLTIYNGDGYNTNPAWSPDGTKLALATRWGIQVLEVDQAGPMLADPPAYFVTHNDGKEDDHPTWSPDGSLIVFSRARNGGYGDLYGVAAAYSGNPLAPNPAVNMTQTPSAREFSPAWSPDGKRLVYSMAYAAGEGHADLDLYVVDWGAYGIPTATRLTRSVAVGDDNADWSSLPTAPR